MHFYAVLTYGRQVSGLEREESELKILQIIKPTDYCSGKR